jgi:hypothetical protein
MLGPHAAHCPCARTARSRALTAVPDARRRIYVKLKWGSRYMWGKREVSGAAAQTRACPASPTLRILASPSSTPRRRHLQRTLPVSPPAHCYAHRSTRRSNPAPIARWSGMSCFPTNALVAQTPELCHPRARTRCEACSGATRQQTLFLVCCLVAPHQ